MAALAACSPTAIRQASGGATTVPERYVSQGWPDQELDSLATWQAPDGRTWLIASGKVGQRLSVLDAQDGRLLRTFGDKGSAPGQFDRPNGLAVDGNLLFVVERDNHRVQVLALPGFATVGTFGTGQLRSPYGIWLNPVAPGQLDAYVTDGFMDGARYNVVPPLPQLAQRVRRFRVAVRDGRITAEAAGAFGDTSARGALKMVESLAGDPAHERLLIADESTSPTSAGSNLREYTLAGRYTGRSLPERSFVGEAEGVALWSCADGAGYWVAVDQLSPHTRFHLFDRTSLRLVGSWQGITTAGTDGIALHASALPGFANGALFAVHDDRAVSAFDLGDVVRKLRLDPRCLRAPQ